TIPSPSPTPRLACRSSQRLKGAPSISLSLASAPRPTIVSSSTHPMLQNHSFDTTTAVTSIFITVLDSGKSPPPNSRAQQRRVLPPQRERRQRRLAAQQGW